VDFIDLSLFFAFHRNPKKVKCRLCTDEVTP